MKTGKETEILATIYRYGRHYAWYVMRGLRPGLTEIITSRTQTLLRTRKMSVNIL